MKLTRRTIHVSFAALFIGVLVFAPNASFATTLPFTTDLEFGTYGSTAVGQLQDFLRTEGYFNEESTGNFLSVTLAAVKAWQTAHCVPSTGYFGPISRQAATEGTLCADGASATSSTTVSTTSSGSANSVMVTKNGIAYVRTTNGLVRISGGSHHHSSDSEDVPTPTYAVTPSGDGHESITPNSAQTTEEGATQSFAVSSHEDYVLSNTVGGTCAAGSWSGSTYTTGAVTSDCTVTFSSSPVTFELTATADGAGEVITSPEGINGGISCHNSTCTDSYELGTHVTISETEDADTVFTGWSGACSGTGACSIIMNADTAVTATFSTAPPP